MLCSLIPGMASDSQHAVRDLALKLMRGKVKASKAVNCSRSGSGSETVLILFLRLGAQIYCEGCLNGVVIVVV